MIEATEKVKPSKKEPEPSPAPAPRARPVPPPKPVPPARRPATQHPPRRADEPFAPFPATTGAAARMHGSGSMGGFAAEQEWAAREAARQERLRKEEARAAREEAKAQRAVALAQEYDDQIAALVGQAAAAAAGSSGSEYSGSSTGVSRQGSGSASAAARWPSDSLPQPLALSSPVAVATPEAWHYGSAAGSLPAWDGLAVEPGGGAAWTHEPQPLFREAQEAPPEEIDALLAMMGIA